MRTMLLVLVVMMGCGSSDKPAPSCQQAVGHYYMAGCTYYDASTNPPTAISQSDFVTFCQRAAIDVTSQCRDELDTWLTCNGDVKSPISAASDCDCSAEYMALLQCR